RKEGRGWVGDLAYAAAAATD
ncbi:hypothetical protein A2U01_0045340, partial [Trifolium medium]|nr:hypothetical protein [Trifolium medium]